jgi:hypothetical protein
MRQIVKGNVGYVITPRLLKEGEPVAVFGATAVATELPDYLIYSYATSIKHCRNLRFGPLLCKLFDDTELAFQIRKFEALRFESGKVLLLGFLPPCNRANPSTQYDHPSLP